MKAQEEFIRGDKTIMVATKAFGMGIDKPNVRFTLNVNHSGSLEAFVQEAGRSGRDKKMALATIMYCDRVFNVQDPRTRRIIPEPVDFVLADTPEGVRAQKDEKEELIAQIADERESFNREAKEQRKIRDELNVELKENLAKAIEFRDQRNEINKEVEENKKARNQVNEQIKNLEWSSGKRDKIKLENEIKKIDKIIETRVLDIKKENQLVKSANDLRKQLSDIKEDDKVKEEAQELKKQSEEYHAKVVELSEKAQEAHEQMLEYFRKTDEIRTAADAAHKKFIQARKSASAKHEDFKMVLSEIHVINKALGSNRSRKRKSNKSESSHAKGSREEKEKNEIFYFYFIVMHPISWRFQH